ncbi:MAG: transglycosylase SLT domain-containing protein [Xanthomonadaceae bacterium]|nr:transglycosylase SLT domain-containing protein [Xanthomonadaceae bacterium]
MSKKRPYTVEPKSANLKGVSFRYFLALISVLICSTSESSLAAKNFKMKRGPQAIEASTPKAPSTPKPKSVSKSLKKSELQRVAEQFSKSKWTAALEQAKKLENKPEYSDFSLYIQSESKYRLAQGFMSKKNWYEAISHAQSAIQQNLKIYETAPESPYASGMDERLGKVELIVADAHAQVKKFATSQSYFHRVFERYKNSKIPSFLTLAQMQSYAKTCETNPHEKCKEWITILSELYPKESLEKKFIIEKFSKWIDPTGNNPYYDRLSKNYKATDPDQVAFEEVLPSILKSDYKDIIEKGQKFLEQYPKTTFRTRILYWIAYAYTARDQKDKAQPIYDQIIKESPISFYAILSSHNIGRDPDEFLKKDPAPASNEDVLLSSDEKRFVQRAKEFSSVGAQELARMELKAIDLKKNFSNPFLVFLANESCKNQGYSVCYRILTELNQRSFQDVYSEAALDLYFPNVLQDSIVPTAMNLSLDPILVTSLIKQESAFSADAVSSVGAMGLMQLMPFTAVAVDGQIEQAKLTDPKTNIKLGTAYLSELIQKFSGNWIYALAGYNAGPHRVDKWVREGGSKLRMTEFIESIPYKETRDYVATIVRNYYWYTYKRTGKKMKTLDVFWGKPLEFKEFKESKPQTESALYRRLEQRTPYPRAVAGRRP